MTRWCVTGWAISMVAKRHKIRASPPLTHPTQNLLNSNFPIPDSRFPIPYSLLPIPYSHQI
ncbi:hypothetical protein [Moorena sp. SIO4G3]|uniref:hypothetical protein n=1 Tax=Moorena sp. SIO4G3 TaxID=2607821 RepID=UPI00142A2546|nr:hypothetical protein [Moorena sp. SIO4G3]NEO81889.1 hypothetical protein [Moorena sp. SIO4G3]